jgi:hypothetical protein
MNVHEYEFPQYADVEPLIRQARLERSVYLAEMFATLVERAVRGFKALGVRMADGLEAERDRRAIEADVFLRRSVGRY